MSKPKSVNEYLESKNIQTIEKRQLFNDLSKRSTFWVACYLSESQFLFVSETHSISMVNT